MDLIASLRSQYLSAMAMLKQAIERCPEDVWYVRDNAEPCWHKAYHVLFYTHLYLQATESDFKVWERHIDIDKEEFVSKETILDYWDFVAGEVERCLPTTDLSAPSGFYWLPFDKLELQIYNIRHIQQHTGELFERLDHQNIELDWVGKA